MGGSNVRVPGRAVALLAAVLVMVACTGGDGGPKRSPSQASTGPASSGPTSSPSPAGTGPTCFGEVATILGTPGPDDLKGTKGNDVMVTFGGNDVVHGGSGADLICGGGGDD